ncbi:MAG: orotidine-5'-phosphate decarboxylase [Bdellovibrionales bacterium]
MKEMKPLSIFLSLDLDNKEQVFSLVKETHPYLLGYKIGPRLFLKQGPDLILKIKEYNSLLKIFLDFKFYDIPSSTLEAVRSAFIIGADYATVHSSVGLPTLKALCDLEKELNQKRFFRILPVTVLSSVEDDQILKKVEEQARLIVESGFNALVCSPLELKHLRKKYKDMLLVTPGIRMQGDEKGDQKRVMTPEEAFQAGSSILVMGRSLIKAQNPEEVLKKLSQKIHA